MTFTVEQKNLLTKLMASENLTVEHQKIHTAKFDPVNRVLYLPIWQDMTGFMYDHLGGHEVGHALYTPADGWHDVATDDSKGKNFKSFLNVVEDARIEKKVTRKFPGLKVSFKKGFQELLDRDFFGIRFKNVNDLPFIERLNLYTKSQYTADYIKFTTEEMVYVTKVQNLETWEDVLALTGEIYDYSKNEQFDMQLEQQMRDFEMFDMDADGDYSESDYDYDESESEDGQPESGKNSKSSDEKSEEQAENTQGANNTDETDNEEFGDEETEPDFDRYKKSVESDRDQFSPECRTDDSYRQNENSLLDEKCKPYLYLDIPTVNSKNVFTPAKRVQELLGNYYSEAISEGRFDNAYVQKLVNDFKNKNDRYVGLLAKEFEMRKAAKAFSKSKLSDTGDIDINKLCNYKFDDNIFRKVMLVPKGKSHGLILLLDCSGSMSDNMAGSIEQILVLSMFCRKVNIPFSVYGFTDCSETYQIDRGLDKFANRRNDDRSFSSKVGELGFSNVQLREYLNSKMSNVEFTKSLRNLILLKESYVYTRGQYNRIGRPESENLSNTPLVQAVFAVGSILNNFRTTNNLDITSLVIVHDGDADNASQYNVEVERKHDDGTIVKHVYGYGFDMRTYNVVVRDRKNKFEYVFKPDNTKSYSYYTNEELLRSALEWIRVVGKTKVFGFFILASRHGQAKNAIRGRYHFEDGGTIEEMRRNNSSLAFETEKALIKKFRDEKFLISNTKGYNSFYLIAGGSDLQTEGEELEINGNVTSHKLKTAFMKMAKKKQVNRVLVSKFIQGMAV
jgi:hypothetical protein